MGSSGGIDSLAPGGAVVGPESRVLSPEHGVSAARGDARPPDSDDWLRQDYVASLLLGGHGGPPSICYVASFLLGGHARPPSIHRARNSPSGALLFRTGIGTTVAHRISRTKVSLGRTSIPPPPHLPTRNSLVGRGKLRRFAPQLGGHGGPPFIHRARNSPLGTLLFRTGIGTTVAHRISRAKVSLGRTSIPPTPFRRPRTGIVAGGRGPFLAGESTEKAVLMHRTLKARTNRTGLSVAHPNLRGGRCGCGRGSWLSGGCGCWT